MPYFSLERAESPESLGIPSKTIIKFIKDIEKQNLELHSFMVVRHNKVAAECYWKPFSPDIPHTMFSVSKSVAATAIGFAVEEGLISLDTKVYSLFPEYVPAKLNKNARMLTIEHLLTMTSGKMASFIYNTEASGWVERFLKAPFLHTPGKAFEYASENTYMLTAIIKKVTGENVLDYLQPRLFTPLGIEKPFWETDKSGLEVGGWGLYLKTEDMAKFINCYMHKGMTGGKQIIPESWVKTASKAHIEKTPGVAHDHSSGYGLHFWRNSFPNSYRADGVFSQLAVAIPDYDTCIITTGGEPMEGRVLDTIWKHFPTKFKDNPLEENPEKLNELRELISTRTMPILAATPRRTTIENSINGKYIKFKKSKRLSSLTVVNNFVRSKKSGQLNNIRMDFTPDYMLMHWTEKYNEINVKVGYDGKYFLSKTKLADTEFTFASTCAWQQDGSFEVWLRPLEHAQVKKFNFRFDDDTHVRLKNWSERDLYELALFALDFKGIKADAALKKIAKGASDVVEPVVDPDLVGRVYTPQI